MRMAINLPDDILVAAKRRASTERTTVAALVERALRIHLGKTRSPRKRVAVRWITVAGGLPPGMNAADRAAMQDWLRRPR